MGTLGQDIQYGLRLLAKNPGFTAVVVLVLAVGIGVNTAVFSVVNAVVLRPLGYEDPGRLVIPWQRKQGLEFGVPLADFIFLREQSRAFEHLAGYTGASFYVTGIEKPHNSRAIAASPSLFPLLGVRPLLGRTFLPEEEQPGHNRVVVVSYAFWRDYLGAAPEAVGRVLNLDEEGHTIVGVMPPEFRFPFARSAPFWVPDVLEKQAVRQMARLKKGVTLEQARAEAVVLADSLRAKDPAAHARITAGVDRLLDRLLGGSRKVLFLLLGAAGCVLLIACGNVAGLFLARAGVRQREVAMRAALGASRARIMRQMLTESLVLSLGAGLLGLVGTFWTMKGLVGLCPADIPRLDETHVDKSVLVFTLSLSVLTGLLFGTMPAWKVSDIRTAEVLKEGWGRAGSGRRWGRLRSGLVIIEIGISLVLLTGAGLLVRSLIALQQVDLGFQPQNLLTVDLELPRMKYPEPYHCEAFFQPLLQRVRTLPGVRAAGLVSVRLRLGSGGSHDSIQVDDRPSNASDAGRMVRRMRVSPGFFEALGFRVLRGRTFVEQDVQGDATPVVIDESLARTFFPDTDPLGHKIDGQTIIGVVSALKDFETLTATRETFFAPLVGDWYFQVTSLVVRTGGDPMRLAGAIRSAVLALDKDQPIDKIETLETTLSGMLGPQRFTMTLLGLFAAIALILAMVGVYGLLQYSATQQMHDIGIRMALGARRVDVLRAILGQGLLLAVIGVVIGLAGALALTRVLSSLLYEVTPADPLTLALVSLLLIIVAAVASYLPARRAARIDPMVALRYE